MASGLQGSDYQVDKVFLDTPLFSGQQSTKVALYTKTKQSTDENLETTDAEDFLMTDEGKSLMVGLFSTSNVLLMPLFELDLYSEQNNEITVHSIIKKDLNNDSLPDLVVNVRSTNGSFYSETTSTFFINTGTEFIELQNSFNVEHYEFQNPNLLIVNSPLYKFGNSYESYNQKNTDTTWRDYYIFNAKNIQNANHLYRQYYQLKLKRSQQKLDDVLKQIKSYKFSDNTLQGDRLQLNILFSQITHQKIIINRCETALN